jgi:hypothetical protein
MDPPRGRSSSGNTLGTGSCSRSRQLERSVTEEHLPNPTGVVPGMPVRCGRVGEGTADHPHEIAPAINERLDTTNGEHREGELT